MIRQSTLCLMTLILFVTLPLTAQENNTEKLKSKLRSGVDRVLKILQNDDLSVMEKKEKAGKITEEMFNYHLMAKLVLGRNHWPDLSTEKREKFVNLFTEVIQASYFDKIKNVTELEVTLKEVKIEGTKKAHVNSTIQAKNEQVKVDYILYREGADAPWRVYDVVIKGVSIVKSYGSQYNDYLQNHSFQELFKTMEEKAKTLNKRLGQEK